MTITTGDVKKLLKEGLCRISRVEFRILMMSGANEKLTNPVMSYFKTLGKILSRNENASRPEKRGGGGTPIRNLYRYVLQVVE